MGIVKIRASDVKPEAKAKKAVKGKIYKQPKPKKGIMKLISKIGGYFKGAWTELRQVRWPNRKASWSMTAAVILFTGFFLGLIVLLDFAFKLLFELIIK